MTYEPDPKEMNIVTNAVAWVLYANGEDTVDVSDEKLDVALTVADHVLRSLHDFREYTASKAVPS